MGARDPRIDRYIATAAPFARPIMERLRELVHAACPDVEESIKWSRPAFSHHGPLVGMSAFKAHMSFGFWKGALLTADATVGATATRLDRLESLDDLPSATAITRCIKRAMALNESGTQPVRAPRGAPKPVEVPPELAAALRTHAKARAAFEGMSPSHRREYCEWISGAKREETRATRLEKTLAQLVDGKALNWKYETRPATKSR